MNDKQDAARYRWLRAQCDKSIGFWWAVCPPAPAAAITSPEELDEAIDRELAAVGKTANSPASHKGPLSK